MIRRCASNVAFVFFCLLAFCFSSFAQEPQSASEIPIERCDVLPVVKVRVDGADMRFLLDTAATTVLNLKTFSSGRSKEIHISSWAGTAATSAREVSLPELVFGEHKLHDLKLPAIDLSPIGIACGGKIDGILGVDLLDKMGVTIDLKRRVASLAPPPADAKKLFDQMESSMHMCMELSIWSKSFFASAGGGASDATRRLRSIVTPILSSRSTPRMPSIFPPQAIPMGLRSMAGSFRSWSLCSPNTSSGSETSRALVAAVPAHEEM